ncbi:MAG: aminoglycoside phosphotransferase [Herbinix sp.]|jgi:Ser/Thr protein kinase RdoA (MazF antagonist)|nr:aminoglycoside phosphotransferase [Herbinix sp.]
MKYVIIGNYILNLEVIMSDIYFPVRYSQLKPEALKNELIKRYELEEPLSCRYFDDGLNAIYKVNAGEKVYYLRISLTGVHEKCDYEEEIFIINTLYKNSLRVAAPVIDKDGSYVWEIPAPEGKRYVVLFEEAKNVPSEDHIKKSYNLGQMLAKLHTISDEHNFKVSRTPIDLIQLAEKPLKLIHPYLVHRPDDYEYLRSSAEKLCGHISNNLNRNKPVYGYCHGDIHSGNVFFEGNNPTIFDFDCMGYGWRIYDISIFVWNETASDEKYIEKEPWKSFLEGYNSVRKLSDIELSSLPAFAALRELWLMGLHADVMELNAGCCWYNDDYFDYRMGLFKLWYHRFINELDLTTEPAINQ